MTADTLETGEPEPIRGAVVIEWPPPTGAAPYTALVGYKTTISDAATGKPITTCTRLVVFASTDEIVTADLTLFASPDGNPVLDGQPAVDRDGEILTGTFRFEVAGMRVRPS